jgi:hypothetical protein
MSLRMRATVTLAAALGLSGCNERAPASVMEAGPDVWSSSCDGRVPCGYSFSERGVVDPNTYKSCTDEAGAGCYRHPKCAKIFCATPSEACFLQCARTSCRLAYASKPPLISCDP